MKKVIDIRTLENNQDKKINEVFNSIEKIKENNNKYIESFKKLQTSSNTLERAVCIVIAETIEQFNKQDIYITDDYKDKNEKKPENIVNELTGENGLNGKLKPFITACTNFINQTEVTNPNKEGYIPFDGMLNLLIKANNELNVGKEQKLDWEIYKKSYQSSHRDIKNDVITRAIAYCLINNIKNLEVADNKKNYLLKNWIRLLRMNVNKLYTVVTNWIRSEFCKYDCGIAFNKTDKTYSIIEKPEYTSTFKTVDIRTELMRKLKEESSNTDKKDIKDIINNAQNNLFVEYVI